jgi:hypothetical protein
MQPWLAEHLNMKGRLLLLLLLLTAFVQHM